MIEKMPGVNSLPKRIEKSAALSPAKRQPIRTAIPISPTCCWAKARLGTKTTPIT